MSVTLYETPESPPCRAVYITAAAIGLKLNRKHTDLFKEEHLAPEFLKLNPQHTLPTLVDSDGTVIWDSHAIATYLVGKYAKNDSLYPKDLAKRALVDQRLHFDGAIVFGVLRRIVRPLIYQGKRGIVKDLIDEAVEAYEFLEKFLENRKWIAGESVTVADYCLLANVSSLAPLVPIDAKKFPKVTAWIKRGQELPELSANTEGRDAFAEFFTPLVS